MCRSRKSIVNVLDKMDHSGEEYSSDEQGPNRDLHLTTTTCSKSRNKWDQRQSEREWKGWMVWIPGSDPGVQNTSRAMPGTSSIEIDPTATPVVHGPRRRPAACSSYEKFSISVLTLSLPRSHQWFSLLSAINFYDVSLENLVVDRLKIPWSLFFFILISCLLDNALTL